MTELNTPDTSITWAKGNHHAARVVHAYLGKKNLKAGRCLCGRKVIPTLVFSKWTLDDDLAREVTCPECLFNLKLLKFL